MRYLRLLILAGLCTIARAATFTAVQNGDWLSNATWGTAAGAVCGTNVPCKGDQVVIPSTFVVTCGLSIQETCSAGTSPADQVTLAISATTSGGGQTCANASTIIYAGPVSVQDNNTFTAGAGCHIIQDSSSAAAPTTAAYTWTMRSSTAGATYSFNGTSGSHIVWEGDSCQASTANGAACAGACLNKACLAGAINYVSGGVTNNVGYGVMTYVDFQNIAGSSGDSTTVAYLANTGTVSNRGGITYSHITFTHCGTVRMGVGSDTDANFIAVSDISFRDCTATTAGAGCFKYGAYSTATTGGAGPYTITGLTADGGIGTTLAASNGPITLRNALAWAGQTGGLPHINVGLQAKDGGLLDQYVVINDGWNSGGAQTNVATNYGINMTNSIIWQDRVTPSGTNLNFSKGVYSSSGTGQNGSMTGNVFGGLGSVDATSHGSDATGGTPAAAATFLSSGNIELAGYNGVCTVPMPGGHFASSTPSTAVTTLRGNTLCNTTDPGGGFSSGSAELETGTMGSGAMATIDSNLFFTNVSGGATMNGIVSTNQLAAASTTTIAFWGGNAITNDTSWHKQYQQTFNITSVANASAGTTVYTGTFPGGAANAFVNETAAISGFTNGVNNGNFVVTASTTTLLTVNNAAGVSEVHAATSVTALNYINVAGTDLDLGTAHGKPVMVTSTRSLPFFDVDYLDPAGLLLVSSYSASAWVTSHSYSVGDVVFVDSSVTGYAAVYGGKRSYWRCTQAHTSGATNQPIIALDGSNPFQEHPAFWEEAFLNYMRAQVNANTDFTAQCNGLLFVTCPSTTYITGLLNAWIREGYVLIDPVLWTGCVAGNGGAIVECGALPLKPIQHIPPPMGVI